MRSPKKPQTERTKEMARAKTLVPKSRNPDARVYEKPIVASEVIMEAASELRADHPLVSDQQAQFVHLLIQTGLSIPRICASSSFTENWAYYHMSKAHVCDYRQAVSIRTLGWASASALSTMRQLLDSPSQYIRLEASRDLMDRAGMRMEPEKASKSTVVMNFNLGAPVAKEVGVLLEQIQPQPCLAQGSVIAPDEIDQTRLVPEADAPV